jgi:hypothetical protein
LPLQYIPFSNRSNSDEPGHLSESNLHSNSSHATTRSENSIQEHSGQPSGEWKEDEQCQERKDDLPKIVIDTISSTSINQSSHDLHSSEIQSTSSCITTPLEPPNQLHQTGSNLVKRRRGTIREDSIDLERGPVSDIEPKSAAGQIKREEDDQSKVDSCEDNPDASDSNRDDERASILSRHVSAHSSFEGRVLDQLRTDAGRQDDEGLFHAFPERKWFRSVIFAQVGFVIMTFMVLGNLIYTYVPL